MNEILQTISFGEAAKSVFVEFRIKSDNLDPKAISLELDLTPLRAFYLGEKYLGKSWDPDSRTIHQVWRERPTGIWAMHTEEFSQKLKKVEQHINYLLDILEPRKEIIKSYINRDDYLVSFVIWWEPLDGHGSFEIESKTLLRMAELCNYVEYTFIS